GERNKAEYAHVAAESQVADERHRVFFAFGLRDDVLEIDAGHDVDPAAGDAEVQRSRSTKLERGPDHPQPARRDRYTEVRAAAENPDAQQARLLRAVEVERDLQRLTDERHA